MQLTTEQLKTLATLADRWVAASTAERDALSAEATALGADFERAFSVMISQLNADNSATLLRRFLTVCAMRRFLRRRRLAQMHAISTARHRNDSPVKAPARIV